MISGVFFLPETPPFLAKQKQMKQNHATAAGPALPPIVALLCARCLPSATSAATHYKPLASTDSASVQPHSPVINRVSVAPDSAATTSTLTTTAADAAASLPPSTAQVVQDRWVWLTCLCYASVCLQFVFFDETFALFLEADASDHGLALSSYETGLCLSLVGVFLLVFQLLLFQPVFKRLGGATGAFRFSAVAAALFFALFPWIYQISTLHNSVLFWVCMSALMMVRSVLNSLQYTSVIMLVNNSAPLHCGGVVNGLGQSFASMV